jgi:SEC-C motif-containing protein
MRSRYTAFTVGDVGYLRRTLAPESRRDFDESGTRRWAQQARWQGLKILKTQNGLAGDRKGVVEFIATYESDGEAVDHHEVAKFRKSDDEQWYFVEGDSHTHAAGEGHHHHHHDHSPQPFVRSEQKVGRNDPCPCGSGNKYKKCHGA